jgi:ribose 5-phosphate isomerase B
MTVFIGADHRGFQLKQKIVPWLIAEGYTVVDCGNSVFDPNDDFPDYAFAVSDRVIGDPGSLGIVICGSGGGVTMAANKVKGVRCGQAVNVDDVVHNRRHDDMNVLALGSDHLAETMVKEMIQAFLRTPFSGEERFIRRLKKIADRE